MASLERFDELSRFQDFKFRQVLCSFFCGARPRPVRGGGSTQGTKDFPSKTAILDDEGVTTNMAISNFTNMVDVSIIGTHCSETNVLSTDF